MIIKKLAGAVAALAIAGLGVLLLASPAHAADGHYPAAGWLVQDTAIGLDVDWSDCDPGPVRVGSVLSSIVDASTVELVGTGVAVPPHYGTSIETPDLGLDVSTGDTISVDYELVDGASAAAGAIRLFIYDHASADTDCTPPAQFVAAPDGPTSGTLSITVDFDGTIGTAGMVYDSSNSGVGGSVRFTNLTVGGTPVRFTPYPMPIPAVEFEDHCDGILVHLANDVDATADATFKVSGLDDGPFVLVPGHTPEPLLVTGSEITVTEEATGQEWTYTWTEPEGCEQAGESPAPGVAGGADDGGQLPVTGSPLPWIAVGGVALIVLGAGLFAVRRKRGPVFTLPQ